MKIRFSILIILAFFSINHVKAITFDNYYDLNECVDYYNSFKNYMKSTNISYTYISKITLANNCFDRKSVLN